MRSAIILCVMMILAAPVYASTLDGYDRAKLADENYALANGDSAMTEAVNDPEFAAVMKKYVYADIVRQAKISQTERKLVEIVVLTTNQNHKFLARVAGEALTLGVKPLEIREALYHVAPYIGFPKVFEALDVVNNVFTAHGITLPLENQGTITDADRFGKGLAFQVGAYGERINKMRDATPDYQKHLQDNLSAFCFGDTYTRGTLDYKTREMLTMAVIGTLGTGEPQYNNPPAISPGAFFFPAANSPARNMRQARACGDNACPVRTGAQRQHERQP